MAAFKLALNQQSNYLFGSGSISLDGEKITIKLDSHSQALLLREGRLIKLAESGEKERTVSGPFKVGDVYTIGSKDEKLIARVEEEKVKPAFQIPTFPKLPLSFKKEVTSRTISLKDTYDTETQGKKTTLLVGVILLVLLFVSVGFGLRQKNVKKDQEIYGTKLEKALSDYNESVNLVSVDKTRARTLFLSAQLLLKEIKDAKYQDSRIENLEKEINLRQGEILGEIRTSPTEFLDLTLQTSGFNGTQLESSGEDMFVYDSESKKAIKVNLKTKKANLAADSDQLNGGKQLASYEDRAFILKDDGIYELGGTSEDKVLDKDWGDNPLYYLYSANIYILDKSANMIYRFPGSTDGFGSKSEWIAPGIEPDFSKVIDMTIDGSIWTLSTTGKVAKFTLGSPQTISLKGLPDSLDNPTAIYTNEENKNVYVLDRSRSRVIVLDKTGEFIIQYVSDQIKDAKDLVVSESQGRLILLNGPKLLTIDLVK